MGAPLFRDEAVLEDADDRAPCGDLGDEVLATVAHDDVGRAQPRPVTHARGGGGCIRHRPGRLEAGQQSA